MLKYFNKIVLYLLIFSSVFAQENSDSYKIGIDYKSKIRVKNLTPDTRDALQNIIEVAFSRILQQTIDLNWPISFDEVAQSKFEAVLKEQKRAENLEDCIDSSCAIELGIAAQAKYMIYRDLISTANGTQVTFHVINIETAITLYKDSILYEGDLISSESGEVFSNLMAKVFNEAFKKEIAKTNADRTIQGLEPVIFTPLPTEKMGQRFTVTPQNISAPEAENQKIKIPHSKRKEIELKAYDQDGDPLVYSIATEPRRGSVIILGDRIIYSPSRNYIGQDIIRFRVSDGLDSDIGTIEITTYNTPPRVQGGSFETNEDQSIDIFLNIKDSENDSVSPIITYPPKNGRLAQLSQTQIRYIPNPGYSGRDYFEFKATDGINESKNTGSIQIYVQSNAINKRSEWSNDIGIDDPSLSESEDEKGNRGLLLALLLLLLIGGAAGAGGGGGDLGPPPTGGVDIGIDIP